MNLDFKIKTCTLPGVDTLSLLLLVTLPFLTGVPSFELNDPFREEDGFSVKLDTAIDRRPKENIVYELCMTPFTWISAKRLTR